MDDRLETDGKYFIGVQTFNDQPSAIWVHLGDNHGWYSVKFNPDEIAQIIATLKQALYVDQEETPCT